MRIAVSAETPNGLDSLVAEHFGHSPAFVLVDVDNKVIGAVTGVVNPYHARHEPGEVPAFVASQGAQVMITGGMGGRAITFFQQARVEPFCGASGTVRHAVEQYLSGGLTGAAACAESVEHGHGHPQHRA